MTQDDAARALQRIGLTEYETRVYLALLRGGEQTGYGVARESGVPRSRVYDVLDGLVRRGAVLVSHGEPVTWAALPAADLIAAQRRERDAALDEAERQLQGVGAGHPPRDLIWDLTGSDLIWARVRQVIARTRSKLLLEIWAEDAPHIRSDVEAATARGVAVTVVAYDDPDWPFATVYLHQPGADRITAEYGGRWVIASADGREIVAGIVSLGAESRAAWTTHPALVMPITQTVRHDVYLAEILASHGDVLAERFGPALEWLREPRDSPLSALGGTASPGRT